MTLLEPAEAAGEVARIRRTEPHDRAGRRVWLVEQSAQSIAAVCQTPDNVRHHEREGL